MEAMELEGIEECHVKQVASEDGYTKLMKITNSFLLVSIAGGENTCGCCRAHLYCMVAHGRDSPSLLLPNSPWTCLWTLCSLMHRLYGGLLDPLGYSECKVECQLVLSCESSGFSLAHKPFPDKEWIRLICMLVLLGSTCMIPPAATSKNIGLQWWGINREGCLLAACPTAKGVTAD
ncbi:hypothetical protein PTKIN_Ptkin04bG0152700 [Pterospermum kingtungense]